MKDIYSPLRKNRESFRLLLDIVVNSKSKEIKYTGIHYAAWLAVMKQTGYYCSAELENMLLDLAEQIPDHPVSPEVKRGSFLHVLSSAYLTGGHTRVVERWIKLDGGRHHYDVCLLNQEEATPLTLKEILGKHHGKLIDYSSIADPEQKARELRFLASGYDKIILHIHPDDIIPMLAFGTNRFERPVLFFNHADHVFWVGRAIADQVLDFRKQQSFTEERRQIHKTYFLSIPMEFNETILKLQEKATIKKASQSPLILIAGSTKKLKPFMEMSLLPSINKILRHIPNSKCLLLGVEQNDRFWQQAAKDSNGRLMIKKHVEYGEEYFSIIRSADLIVDSWPLGGGCTMMDAIQCNIPVVSLSQLTGQCDYLIKSSSYCRTFDELEKNAIHKLTDCSYAEKEANHLKELLYREASPQNWVTQLNAVLEETPTRHSVIRFNPLDDTIFENETTLLIRRFYENSNRDAALKHFVKKIFFFIFKYFFRNDRISIRFIPFL